MSAPQDVAKQLPVRSGGTAPPRDPVAGWRGIGCRATSRGSPMNGVNAWFACEVDALAEAGATGLVSDLRAGAFCCDRRLDRCTRVPCRTMVCPMAVGTSMRRSKGRNGCMCRCRSFRKAARQADERGIAKLSQDLAGNPDRLTKKEEIREALVMRRKPRPAQPVQSNPKGEEHE